MRRSPMPKRAAAVNRAKSMTRRIVKAKRATMTAAERNARKVVKARSQSLCEMCGRAEATNMHHRKNRSQGGAWTPGNLLHLCGSGTTGCHGSVGDNVALSRERGWSVLSTDDPTEMPVFLAGRGWVFLLEDGSTTQQETAA